MEGVNQVDLAGQDISILAVDDVSNCRLILDRVLKKQCGYKNVTIVGDPKEALELIHKKQFDLILCDLMMPGIDGIGVVQQVRKIPNYAKVPFVMMSSAEDLDSNYRCLLAGADHYILKPLQASQLKNLYIYLWRKNVDAVKDKEMSTMREENEKLKSQFSEAVETPINVITKTISSISQKDLSPDVQSALGVIIKSLGSSNLYRPAFSKILEQSDITLDSTTKRWLSQELRYDIEAEEGAPRPTEAGFTWPQVKTGEHSEALRSWEFDCLGYSPDDLLPLIEEMFSDFNLFDVFAINIEKFRKFLLLVRDSYKKNNPYHNFKHAFDVTQAAYLFLTRSEAAQYLNNLEILSLLISALGHDLKHPGLNNTYLVVTGDQYALTYNDKSVLENMHATTLFEIIRSPGCEILSGMKELEYRDFRKMSINLILSTDMACHGEHIARFQSVIPTFSREKAEHRELLCSLIMKASDISNPARSALVSRFWSDLIQEEFWQQGDVERRKGLKISPFMDRQNPQVASMSIGFIDFFVLKLFTEVGKVLPNTEEIIKRLNETRERWVKIKEEEEKQKSAEKK
eukprot:TRINITY_DN2854_c0_g1_i2.p1 TRINITY_DN2854_c0_g1~~TRINITY_DN2854_c0_g1_i2.p1  ORF type:complete len:573 (-),score=127.83 TRINITY_DN2854_c0_g1_i2:13-1731(-)